MVGEEDGGLTVDAVDGGVRLVVLGGMLGHSVSLSPSGWRLLPLLKVRQEKEDENGIHKRRSPVWFRKQPSYL